MPDIDDILSAVETHLSALALELVGTPVAVTRSKQPRQEDAGDTAAPGRASTQITVAAAQSRPKSLKRFSNIHDLYTFRVQAVVWTPGNADNSANVPTLSAWEGAIEKAFCRKPAGLLGLTGLRDVRATPGTFLDRAGFGVGWDTSATDIDIEIVAPRVTPP